MYGQQVILLCQKSPSSLNVHAQITTPCIELFIQQVEFPIDVINLLRVKAATCIRAQQCYFKGEMETFSRDFNIFLNEKFFFQIISFLKI